MLSSVSGNLTENLRFFAKFWVANRLYTRVWGRFFNLSVYFWYTDKSPELCIGNVNVDAMDDLC